jgi:hypothetical protein
MTEQSMKVSRDVILDLLPLYLAREASVATRALVEQYLSQDVALADQIRLQVTAGLGDSPTSVELPPELELRSLGRTRTLLRRQRLLFGIAIGLSVLALTSEVSFAGNRFASFHFLIRDFPLVLGPVALAAVGCWIAYIAVARRLRTRT